MIIKINIKNSIQIFVRISSLVYLEKLKNDLNKLVNAAGNDIIKVEEEFDAYLMRHHWLELVNYMEVNV